MSMNYLLADALTRIRNAQMAKHKHAILPCSRLVKNSLSVLQREGFIEGFQEVENDLGQLALKVDLKYKDKEAVISNIEVISTPGCKVYSAIDRMPKVRNGLGIMVVSTSKGVMSDDQARVEHIGGELLFKVY